MKVAIICDHLLRRDHSVEMVERVLEIYPEAEIYTLSHQQGVILGPLENVKIHASFLTHQVKTLSQLEEKFFLIPSACEVLSVPCSVDLAITISSGLSLGVKKCEKTRSVVYLFGDSWSSIWEKNYLWGRGKLNFLSKFRRAFFGGFMDKWFLRHLKSADEIWFASEWIRNQVNLTGKIKAKTQQVVWPPFKIEDYPLIPSTLFKHDYWVVEADAVAPEFAQELITYFKNRGEKYYFIGNDEQLSRYGLREGHEDLFLSEKCSGELAPILSGCRALISSRIKGMPKNALACLAEGRPLINCESPLMLEYLGEGKGIFYMKESTIKEFIKCLSMLEVFENQEKEGPSQAMNIRARAMRFHSSAYKIKMKKLGLALIPSNPQNQSQSTL